MRTTGGSRSQGQAKTSLAEAQQWEHMINIFGKFDFGN